MRRFFIVLLVLLSAVPAAGTSGVEIVLGAGYRFGDTDFPIEAKGPLIACVTTPCILANAATDDGEVIPSLTVDVPLGAGPWMIEALYTETDGDLELRSVFRPDDLLRETYDSSTLLVGVLRSFGDGPIRPFAAAGLGVTRFEVSAPVYERPLFPGIVAGRVDEEVAVASLAGGVKMDLGPRWLARLEARAFFHDLPARAGGSLEQGELSVGLGYRF